MIEWSEEEVRFAHACQLRKEEADPAEFGIGPWRGEEIRQVVSGREAQAAALAEFGQAPATALP